MAGNPYLNQVTDPNAKKALQQAFDLIAVLQTTVNELRSAALLNTTQLNAKGQRIVNLSDPQAASDAANAGYVRAYAAAQLEAFKGVAGVDGTFLSTDPFTITVQDGLIVSIL